MQSTGQLGQMESFDVTASDWTAYKERLTSFLIVNKVPDSDKAHAFLSIIGPRTYGLLKSLTAPDLPSAKSFEQLKSILDAHLAPVPSVIGERAKFYRRAQHEGEPLPEYVAELRKLSQTCQFVASLDEALRDRFVCGLLREDVQRVLFTEGDTLTFSRAVDRALAMEAARKNVAETRVVEALATQLHKVEDDSREAHADLYEVQTRAGKPLLVCYRCGSPSHTHEELHEGHPGIVRSKALARSYVWWPCIEADLERMVQSCAKCQEQRSAPGKAPLHPWSWPTAPWQRIHIHFAGPFQQSMFLIVVDAHSKWPEVFVMPSTTTEATIQCLRDVFARFGFPETIVSDNGPQFTSQDFKQFVREMGCRHVQTAPYNPSANGLAERFVQTLKNALRKDDTRQPLKVKLNKFLLAYRNTPHATTHEAPANLLLGRRLRTRLDVLKPVVGERVAYEQFKQTVNRPCRVREVALGDHVLARNYRGQPKWMPAVVMAQTGPVSFKVRVSTPSGCLEGRRHKNQLLQSTTVPAENVVQDDEFSVGPHSDLGSGPAAENSVEGDGFTVGPHSDPGSGQAFSVPPASVSHHRRRRLTPHGVTRIDATQSEIVDHLIGSKQERELW
ncbi:uncharacterized protein LOC142570433 [Dermacentor variabilis]|uniref:uncharacterized protein LOC142570433 n=1 Tax=Dermacentor variabilis TaxID=34621 RepID=UPI003F5BE257